MNTKKNIKQKIILCSILYIIGSILLIYLSAIMDKILSGNDTKVTFLDSIKGLWLISEQRSLFIIFNILLLTACAHMIVINFHTYKSNLIKVTEDIFIPAADGQNQHGSARFVTDDKEIESLYSIEYVDPTVSPFKEMLESGLIEYHRLVNEAALRHELERFKNFPSNNDITKISGEIVKNLPGDIERDNAASYIRDLSIENEENLYFNDCISEDEYNQLKDDEYSSELDIDYDVIAAEYEELVETQDFDDDAAVKMSYIRDAVISQDIKHMAFKPPFSKGGLVVGMEKNGQIEKWFLHTDDTHNLIVGATRSGKSRSLVIQSIFAMAMGGESLVLTDPKAELYQYTSDFLRNICGYTVCCIDFRNPAKSDRYNLLQPVIDAINRDDVEKAEEAAGDLTNILVSDDSHSEKIWTNGEKAIIAGSIIAVVFDNMKHPEFQNLTNVYWFVAEMAKEVQVGQKMRSPLEEYAKALPSDHPAKATFAIADVAPGRTKGSFYTSALTTLKLFTMRYMFSITYKTDIDIALVGKSKMALFIVLPDERTTYYPIASLIISQLYEILVRQSDERGGRLLNRVNFVCDEFGNFTKLTDFTNKITVGGGRGIRFHLFLQALTQLDEKYDEKTAAIIKGNCETWIYLKTEDNETHEIISKKLGKYTTSAYQLNANHSKYVNPQSGHSTSLIGRELLFPDEVGKIKRPYQLVICRGLPAILKSFDLSQWYLNQILAMGDENHNIDLRLSREESREKRSDCVKISLWGIWNDIGKVLEDWNILFIQKQGKIEKVDYDFIKKRLVWAATGVLSKEQSHEEAREYQKRRMEEKILFAKQKQLERFLEAENSNRKFIN